jgi:drug/metabolite transporter (DMT)-like permease
MNRTIPWDTMAGFLLAAVTCELLAGLAASFQIENVTNRFRLEQAARYGASSTTAILVLGAVLALMYASSANAEPRRLRALFAAAFAIATVVAILAFVSALSLLFAETANSFTVTIVNWNHRLAFVLPRITTAAIGFVAAYFASRYAPARENPATT